MSAAALAAAERRVDPLAAFTERAAARAYLWSIGEYELAEAVDELQAAAVRDGLVDELGQDEVQRLMSEAFAAVRDDNSVVEIAPQPARLSTPRSTIEAVMYAVRTRGIAALKEPATVERLKRCDEAARKEINARIAKLQSGK